MHAKIIVNVGCFFIAAQIAQLVSIALAWQLSNLGKYANESLNISLSVCLKEEVFSKKTKHDRHWRCVWRCVCWVLFDYTETELDLEPVWFTRFTLLSSKFHWNRIQAAVTIQAFITCWDTSHWRDKLITRRTSKHRPGKHFFLSTSNDLTTNA